MDDIKSATFVATFADGETVRMTTSTELDPRKLNWARGLKLAQYAWQARMKRYGELDDYPPAPTNLQSAHFEQDGVIIARYECATQPGSDPA
jgi:hypothetical protein